MPNTLHDIKDKLLSALDQDYNVVDMATVIEVISILEKTSITKDALEKTRIGKFINELRKKTSNEQLARRAKELVKKWRKLLPVPDHPTFNGERVVGSISTPPVGMTPAGPGPGPGVGPGPGPGNKPASPAICRSGSGSVAKFASPALMPERVTSPCSSASNSPHLPPRHQGSNRTTVTPSMLVTNKLPVSDQALSSIVSNGNSATCNQMFKPVSPALAAVHMASGIGGKPETQLSGTNLVACPKPHSPAGRNPASLHNSSRSLSPCLNISSKTLPSRHLRESSSPHSSAQHPTISPHSGISHSSLELAKTNAANKRLRKEISLSPASKKRRTEDRMFLNTNMANGMDPAHFKNKATVEIMPSKGSAFESVKATDSKDETKEQESAFNDNCGKKKKKIGLPSEHEGPKPEGLSTGLKLQKVKTTQQLIAELQAKKGAMPSIDLPTITSDSRNCRTNDVTLGLFLKRSGNCALFGSDAEVNKTKSELMDRFLQASAKEKGLESPAQESMRLDSVPPEDKTRSHVDRVGEEIKKLMASLPDVSSLEIKEEEEEEEEYIPIKTELTEEAILKISTENWENVNGEYNREGKWKEWHEMTTRESYEGDSLNILPYVNIDW